MEKPSATVLGGILLPTINAVLTVDWHAHMTSLGLKIMDTIILGFIGALVGWGTKQLIDFLKNKLKPNGNKKINAEP